MGLRLSSQNVSNYYTTRNKGKKKEFRRPGWGERTERLPIDKKAEKWTALPALFSAALSMHDAGLSCLPADREPVHHDKEVGKLLDGGLGRVFLRAGDCAGSEKTLVQPLAHLIKQSACVGGKSRLDHLFVGLVIGPRHVFKGGLADFPADDCRHLFHGKVPRAQKFLHGFTEEVLLIHAVGGEPGHVLCRNHGDLEIAPHRTAHDALGTDRVDMLKQVFHVRSGPDMQDVHVLKPVESLLLVMKAPDRTVPLGQFSPEAAQVHYTAHTRVPDRLNHALAYFVLVGVVILRFDVRRYHGKNTVRVREGTGQNGRVFRITHK